MNESLLDTMASNFQRQPLTILFLLGVAIVCVLMWLSQNKGSRRR